jgi:hypothetical protein
MTSKTISERMRAIGDTPIAYGKDAIEAAIARAALAKAQRGL